MILTITPHPHGEALLQAAVLAPVPVVLGDLAVFVAAALVAQLFADRPLEEPLAALARPHAVVLARRVVAAHRAQQARPARLARAVAAAVGGG